MANQKPLKIPYIKELSTATSSEQIISLLESASPRQSIDKVNWSSQFPYQPLTTFNIGHSGESLFIDFFTRCNFLRAENYMNNSPVSEDSCVEFFVKPDPGKDTYWNFEFNCIGTTNASHREVRECPTRLNDQQIASIKRYASCGNRPFKELEGLFSWNLLVEIPLSLLGVKYEGKPIEMLANFYKCASKATQPHYLSWKPISTPKPDFHRTEFFAPITLL